jgi:hypothetical protein
MAMESKQSQISYRVEMDEWDDWSAWQGYEFWSSQLEAEMEFFSELQEAVSVAALSAPEGKNDVLPF